MKHAVRLLVAALVAIFGWLAAPMDTATASTPHPVATTYTYDAPRLPTEHYSAITERGPPTVAYDYTAHRSAVDAASSGTSARPQPLAAWNYTTYDHAVQLAQVTIGSDTTLTASAGGRVDVCPVSDARCAANAGSKLLSPSSLADEVANATGGVLKTNKGGFTVEIPSGSRGITVRVMERGGARTNYYRVSVPGKATYTVRGEASTDAALTQGLLHG